MADDELVAPRVFVTDHLSSLGQNRMGQVAVVGALMDLGLHIHADFHEIEPNWYVGQIQALGFPQLSLTMLSLLQMKFEDAPGILSATRGRRWNEAGREA